MSKDALPSEQYIAHVIDEVQVLDQMVDALIATVGDTVALGGEALDVVMGDLVAPAGEPVAGDAPGAK